MTIKLWDYTKSIFSVLNAASAAGHRGAVSFGLFFGTIWALIKLALWPVVFVLWCIELVILILAFPFKLFAKKR